MSPRSQLASVPYAYKAEVAPLLYSGARDIDANVTEKVYIHIEKKPASVVMYLYGEKFSPQFYTELGLHMHSMQPHSHSGDSLLLATGRSHSGNKRFYLLEGFEGWGDGWVSGNTGEGGMGDTNATGVNGGAISAVTKTYLSGMQVLLDGTNITSQLLAQAGLAQFGDGASSHTFNTIGSGELNLTNLSDWSAGEHKIEFIQPCSTGGRIKYYIYVE